MKTIKTNTNAFKCESRCSPLGTSNNPVIEMSGYKGMCEQAYTRIASADLMMPVALEIRLIKVPNCSALYRVSQLWVSLAYAW